MLLELRSLRRRQKLRARICICIANRFRPSSSPPTITSPENVPSDYTARTEYVNIQGGGGALDEQKHKNKQERREEENGKGKKKERSRKKRAEEDEGKPFPVKVHFQFRINSA